MMNMANRNSTCDQILFDSSSQINTWITLHHQFVTLFKQYYSIQRKADFTYIFLL